MLFSKTKQISLKDCEHNYEVKFPGPAVILF